MHIRKTIERFPGGMMVVPLLVGATMKTCAPRLLALGSFSTAISQGAMPILAVFFVCMGAEIQLRAAPRALRKGLAITLSKLASGVCIGLLIAHFAPGGRLFGLSGLAVIAAMTNANMGLYAALSKQYGNADDAGALAVLSVLEGPFLTMLALGASGLVHVPLLELLATVLPILTGMVLGNLDQDLRALLSSGGTLLIPFFAFGLGAQINLQTIWAAGASGVLLGLVTLLLGGLFNLIGSRLGGGGMIAGAAVSTTAGNAVATPLAIAAVDSRLAPLAALATPQIAASTVITSLLAPVLTAAVARYEKRARRQVPRPAEAEGGQL
ncbi:2-keto-3-deoxygluconate permease [Frateuria aurantia]